MDTFTLDDRLATDSVPVAMLSLCELRLMRDGRWPWLLLVPRRAGLSEIFDLTAEDQALIAVETARVATLLKDLTGATKINIGALGNIIRQLHIHVIARSEGDPAWPGPVWGFGTPEHRDAAALETLKTHFLERL
ncbi:Diadenosine tetraphosphate (Ap4A) hydrolase [Rhizobium sp. RU20A]|uniref:HIT family protein n=1 Tax=Rhizobium sp. RU20A TaxID=1907412 RepID=UPI0009558D7A|nr:HIT family protein [Rhizobium sp. RU20A]SIQ75699.1 Diadenosine tetraphosphate (Ap4A) hydrolase [Rhizobium sp. RU20A]